jgi:hypothetical protein
LPVTSFVAEAFARAPEIPVIDCVSVTETAAEKLVSLTRRSAMELAGLSREPDHTLVRHVYDLHMIRDHIDFAPGFRVHLPWRAGEASQHESLVCGRKAFRDRSLPFPRLAALLGVMACSGRHATVGITRAWRLVVAGHGATVRTPRR